MSTVHSYTNDQRILDFPHTDLRRARAAGVNLIPTSTGAAKATGLVIPDLKGRFDGLAVRTPTPDGSLVDLSILLEQEVSVADINSAVKKASETTMKGVIEYSEAALVLTDIIGNSHSAIFDAPLTMVSGKLAKVIAWYDNEWGYSVRVADLLKMMINLDQ
jgi:glyceraldehyde 3-phosphate dehydrogenase